MTGPEASTTWREVIAPDEETQVRAFIDEIRRFQQSFADRGDGHARRSFHVKSHAALRGEFKVMDDIPAKARHGLFETPRAFPAWVRLSNGFSAPMPDWFPDMIGWAVKLRNVPGVKLASEPALPDCQDFLSLNHAYLPVADARQLVVMSTATGNLLTGAFQVLGRLGLADGMRVIAWGLGWGLKRPFLRSALSLDFHGLAPITLGPHAVKFKWASRQGPARAPAWFRRNHLREDLHARLRAGDLRYDFLVQFYVDERRTPIDGAYAWREDDAPFVKLAELIVPRCDPDGDQARADELHLDGMTFNPWHALPAHRPIGNIQRARRLVYEASARRSGRNTPA